MRRSYLIIIGVFLVVATTLNFIVRNPTFNNLEDQAEFELLASQNEKAEITLNQIVLQNSLSIQNHYRYIINHFDIPERKKIGKNSYKYRDDQKIQDYYDLLIQSPDSAMQDIGHYGKGLIQVCLEQYSFAISEFQKVKNKKLDYLNNSLGNAYYSKDQTKLAEIHFRKEIEQNGNLDGAYTNLIQLLFDQNRTAELDNLLDNTETKKYFPPRIERHMYFNSFQLIKYGTILFQKVYLKINVWGLLAALLIMCSWTIFLRKLDIFEVEQWRHIIFTLILGMVFSFLTYPLSDFDNLFFGFKLNGGLINDFFYSIIGIGAIEELVKILPLLLLMRFTKIVNEPFDYIKYASLSALGFAFVENLTYFNESSLNIIHGRALTAVVSHMFNSSLIAYGIILNKYKQHKNPYLNFIFFFTLASISHGLYDFWLINKSASEFSIFTVLLLIISMYVWNSFKNNALNQSNFYDKEKSIDNEKLYDYLLYSLTGILLFEYLALALNYSPSIANQEIISSIYSGTYLIFFLTINLSKFSIIAGKWAPIKYWDTDNDDDEYENLVGTELKITSFTNNEYANKFLPNSGKITQRLTVYNEKDWFLIKLNYPKEESTYLSDSVIIRTKDKYESIEKGQKTIVAFYLIPKETNLKKSNLKRTHFKFCGWATTS